jgi:Ca2+-transporting ATPase
MVTGDHLLTAKAIAEKIDLLDDRQIVSGAELEAMTIPELSQRVEKIAVYARVDPAHKVKIINALKERGHIVAMTGDGVNDAPAVKRADIGISMGISGTDVTKEASDMILADDNFATIVSAIREGRLIFDNLKKFILFLLSCNISEVLIMFLTMLAGLPLPLLPIQILWINLVTDGLPALALGVDPPDPDLMKRPPRSIKESIVGREHLKQISWQGLLMTLGAIFAFLAILIYKKVPLTLANGAAFRDEIAIAQTATFTTMVLVQLFHSLNYRSEIFSLFSSHTFKNYFLLLAVAGSILLQLAVMYVPPLKLIFKTTSLGQTEWLIVLIAVLLPILIIDRIKVARGKRKRK